MKDLAIDQLYACAAKVIEGIRSDLSEEIDLSPSARKDTVAMLQKLANLLLQLNKLQALSESESGILAVEDRAILEEFLEKHRVEQGQ